MACLGLGVFYGGVITGIPIVTGVAEGVHHQKKMNAEAANETRMVKFHLDVECERNDNDHERDEKCREKSNNSNRAQQPGEEIDGMTLVMLQDKVWLAPKDPKTQMPFSLPPRNDHTESKPIEPLHPFTGFYIMYPDEERNPRQRGLVSTISTDPPMLNWLYVDRETHEVRYSNRTGSIAHVVGPWDWTEDEAAVTLEDWEGFVAVEESTDSAPDGLRWALYFDRDDDGFRGGKLVDGKRIVECTLVRRILPEEVVRQQNEEAESKMQVKSTGDLKTKWG